MQIRPAHTRGRSSAPKWLDTWHSFSFSDWHDARYMGFGPLRVLNDDTVAPGMGFGAHPHRDMEIVSYVLAGALEHHDSTGTRGVIRPGEVQFMRAGSGVIHGEMNASKTEPVHFLQVWILPDHRGTKPAYDQRKVAFHEGWAKLAGGEEGAIPIDSSTRMRALKLAPGERAAPYVLSQGRAGYLYVAEGALTVGAHELAGGDALVLDAGESLETTSAMGGHALFFDVPAPK